MKDPLIAYNGGLIIDYENEEERVLFSEEIPLDVTGLILQFVEKSNIHISLYHNDEWYVPAMDYWAEREQNNTKVTPQVADLKEVHQSWISEQKGPMLDEIERGYDLVVGARQGIGSQASMARWSANTLYNKFSSSMVGHQIDDLTSGFRAARRERFMEFLYLLPNGFSYPTTSTMAFFRAGYSVSFIPIEVAPRLGKSHINLLRDGVRFFLIIFKIGSLYSPLKIFFPLSILLAMLGMANYAYTYLVDERFTNMSAMMLLASIMVFLIGLVSEQITNLMYKDH